MRATNVGQRYRNAFLISNTTKIFLRGVDPKYICHDSFSKKRKRKIKWLR